MTILKTIEKKIDECKEDGDLSRLKYWEVFYEGAKAALAEVYTYFSDQIGKDL